MLAANNPKTNNLKTRFIVEDSSVIQNKLDRQQIIEPRFRMIRQRWTYNSCGISAFFGMLNEIL